MPAERMTVSEWADGWLAGRRPSAATRNAYAAHVRQDVRPRLGHLRLDQLKRP
ncbi:hypothetical protein ACFC09_15750 [Streptomyces sp. NPDC056161]|uniref:hypothetical protein n=1 Tax=Streptomyces sp. NPDC056161 TaxID=3345732 RepID=UPI0035D6B47D